MKRNAGHACPRRRGRVASYRINGETGAPAALDVYNVGKRPAAVLAVPLSR